MKKLLLTGLTVWMALPVFSQSVERSVMASGGNSFSNSSFSIDWTIGETVVTQASAGNTILSQGFHQFTASSSVNTKDLNTFKGLKCYPNPASDLLNLSLDNSSSEAKVRLFDAGGKLIADHNWKTSASYALDLSKCAPGIYTLQIILDGKIHVLKLSRI